MPASTVKELPSSLFARMPMLAFDLRLKSAGLPLLEVSDTFSAMAAAGQVDADQLGRFLLTTLTFMGQPRMAEQASTVNNSARQAIDRARAAKRLDPQVSMKEVRLIIDLPGEVKDVVDAGEGRIPGPDGVPLNRMPWRRVRMFWRWRLGRLEVVRPHVRGRSKTACCGG